jgi:hypothetical protein
MIRGGPSVGIDAAKDRVAGALAEPLPGDVSAAGALQPVGFGACADVAPVQRLDSKGPDQGSGL